VRAFSAATGEKIWDTDIGRGRIADVPLAVGPNGTIYTGTNNYPGDGARVTALNATTGTIKWSVVLEGFNVSGIALATDGTLFITAQNTTKLTALNPVDGAIKWEYTHGGFSPSAPSVGPDGTVYFTSGSNAGTTLYAVK
ncbi:MAG: PQQ-binding-like beta-propeller repeat protein, partial [Chthonomonadales bacterium]